TGSSHRLDLGFQTTSAFQLPRTDGRLFYVNSRPSVRETPESPAKGANVVNTGQQVVQRSWWIALFPMVVAYVADLWSKEAVLVIIEQDEGISVLETLLYCRFILYLGAAFSIGV